MFLDCHTSLIACAVVDPKREVQLYFDTAKAMGLKIAHVPDTHRHADFISGHMDLAEKTGAKICALPSGTANSNIKVRLKETPLR